ncbi:protein kinase domain-containing protein [Paractinoplanes pyxinae]|uniref:serine/threonine-protein kinase n=1 Tax=Paractinoplanes pyxinae TaxID=2997416 RepID=UPI003F68D9D6
MSSSPPLVVADRYRLVAPLGQGGMGRVWRATDVVLHREVAIKELVPPPGLTAAERQEMRERSLREARAIARLNNINVVRVFDVLRTDADPWIVMEYVPSRSLQDTLAADGPFSPVRAAEIGLGVLNALRAAHRAGVVHRDVKPGNVLIGAEGRVVLTDFGLATVPGDPNVTRTGLVLGSPAYIAPERARDGSAGPAADLWSLGATLYAAVEGASPFARPSAIATLAALATENPPPARNAGPMKPVLNGLLRKDPTHRINAEEAERLLLRAAGRRSKLSFPMSPTMRRPGVGRDRAALTGGTASTPVVPGPRPPVARPATPPGRTPVTPSQGRAPATPPQPPVNPGRPGAGEGRPHFAPGKAPVGRPAAETPTRVDTPKVDAPRLDATRVDGPKLDATRVDGPPVRDDKTTFLGTGSGAPDAARPGPHASGGLSRTSRGAQSGFTAADVAANRRKKAAPEHEKSLSDATSLIPRVKSDAPTEEQRAVDPTTRIAIPPKETAPRQAKPSTTAPVDKTTRIPAPVDPTTKITPPATKTPPVTPVDKTNTPPVAPINKTKTPPVAPIDKTTKISDAPVDRTTKISEPVAPVDKTTKISDAPVDKTTKIAEPKPANKPGAKPAEKVEPATAKAQDTKTDKPAAAETEKPVVAAATSLTSPAESAPAAGDAENAPSSAENVPAEQDAKTTAAELDAKSTPAELDAKSTPAELDAKSTPAELDAKSTPGEQDAKSTPAEQDAKSTSAEGDAKTTPAEGDAKSGSAKDAPAVDQANTTPAEADAKSAPGKDAPAAGRAKTTPVEGDAGSSPTSAGAKTDRAVEKAESTPAKEDAKAESTPNAKADEPPAAEKADESDAAKIAGAESKDSAAAPAAAVDRVSTDVPHAPPRRTRNEVPPATDRSTTPVGPGHDDPEPMSPAPAFNRSSRPAWTPMPVRQSPGVTVFGTRLTYGQAAVGGGVVLLIIVLVVVLIGVLGSEDGGDDNQTQQGAIAPTASAGGTSQQPAAGGATTSTPSPKPTTTAPPSSPAGLALPSTWRIYSDGSGYKVPLPKSASIRQSGSETQIRWNNRYLLIDQTDDPKPDALADWKQQERDRANRDYRDYEKVKLVPVSNYFKQAADWEFYYTTSTGNAQHAVKRNIIVSDSQAYSISWYVSPDDWAASQADLKRVYQWFQPKK